MYNLAKSIRIQDNQRRYGSHTVIKAQRTTIEIHRNRQEDDVTSIVANCPEIIGYVPLLSRIPPSTSI